MQIQIKVFLIFFYKVLILSVKNLLVFFVNAMYLQFNYFLYTFAKKRLWQQTKQKI